MSVNVRVCVCVRACMCACADLFPTGVLLMGLQLSCSALRPVIPMHNTLMHRCAACLYASHTGALVHECTLTCIWLRTCLGGFFWFLDWLSSYQSIHQLIARTHPHLLRRRPLPRLCRLDLPQLLAGFKDKEILIELLCNSASQCITRQLDINRPPSSACMCVCVRACERISASCVSVVKSFLIDPTRGCCDLLLQADSLSPEFSPPDRLRSLRGRWTCVFTLRGSL